jgi:DNA-binding response OmpR family regulator
MPNMSGYELFKTIRKTNNSIPLTIISNYSDKEKLLNSIPLALANYLIKPVKYATLTQTLITMLHKLEDETINVYTINKDISYNKFTKELMHNKKRVTLSKNEIITLELLLTHQNKIVSTKQIEYALDEFEIKSAQAIKSLLYRLRKKLSKEIILNISGYGYMLKTDKQT